MSKRRELIDEFRQVVLGRANLLDSILPPLLFVILNALLGFDHAMWGSLALAVILGAVRLARSQSPLYALGGVAGVALAMGLTWLLGQEEGYFLPGIVSNGLLALLCLLSVVVRRPLVAWTSYLARRWPLAWYWQPRVRPAYSEVTALWLVFFAGRLVLQLVLYQREAVGLLALLNVVSGWPATVVLLAASYLYGTWRLRRLGGPSVEEFEAGAKPPWQGQQRGF
ncbi:MAG: DUF3159 domain-containing protein [Anaerolineae bacterium]|jgi:hypothetical protein